LTNFSLVDSARWDLDYKEKSQRIKEILSKRKAERDTALSKQMYLLMSMSKQEGSVKGRNHKASLSALNSSCQPSIMSRSPHYDSALSHDFGCYRKKAADGRVVETVRLSDILNRYGHLQQEGEQEDL